jgi:hypothetical protein
MELLSCVNHPQSKSKGLDHITAQLCADFQYGSTAHSFLGLYFRHQQAACGDAVISRHLALSKQSDTLSNMGLQHGYNMGTTHVRPLATAF